MIKELFQKNISPVREDPPTVQKGSAAGKDPYLLFFYGCLVGIAVFLCIYGFRVLNFTYTDWLMVKQDSAQHYLGWIAFRQTPWAFPLGLTNALSYPLFTSLIYTDSIPLFALPFKALSALLPSTFQYFGLWTLLCYALQGGLSAILLHRFVKNKGLCFVGSAFFALSMPLFMRMSYHHDALVAQWILLLGFSLWLYEIGKSSKTRCAVWGGMGFLCSAVHLYFVPMVGIILLGCAVTDYYIHRKIVRSLLPVAVYVAVCALVLWSLGAFYGNVSAYSGGMGSYVSNLNTLYNPLNAGTLLKPLPVVFENYEGSAYLGAGILLLCVVSLFLFFRKGWRASFQNRKRLAFVMGAAVMALLSVPIALGPNITLNGRVLFTIPYPHPILLAFATFRASGRFSWIVFYLIMLFVIGFILRRMSKGTAYILLAACLCIQAVDFGAFFGKLHEEYAAAPAYQNQLQADALMRYFAGNPNYRHIQFLDEFYEDDYLLFAGFAMQSNMTVSDFYFARNSDKIDVFRTEELNRIISGAVSRDTIYVAKSISGVILNGTSLHWYRVGNYAIGVANVIPGQDADLISQHSMRLLPNGGQFLSGGEETVDKRILYPGGLSYGPYISLEKGTYRIKITGMNLSQCQIEATANGGKIKIPLHDTTRREDLIEYSFVLDENTALCEFLIYNPQGEDIVIETMELSSPV